MKKESAEPTSTGGLSKMLTSSEVARLLGVASPRYREDDVLEWLERVTA